MIAHSRPTVGPEEERALLRQLRSGQLGTGREVDAFERDLAREVGTRFAVATHTGTSALHLALLALGIGRGDRVVLPTYVCAAVLHAIRYTGARPVLVDVDPETGNAELDAIRRAARRARAVLVPHMFGLPAPIAELRSLKIPIIEDCAMSIGATIGRKPCGSFGDLSIFSFYATKVLATGHGGGIATSRPDLHRRIRDLVEYDNRDDDRVRYNYRMSGLVAALGRVQLRRLPEFVQRRRRIAEFYYARLGGLPLGLPPREAGHIYYRFVIRGGRDLSRRLAQQGVEAKRPVYRPLHRYLGGNRDEFPGAEELHRIALSLPLYPSLSPANARRVADAVQAACRPR